MKDEGGYIERLLPFPCKVSNVLIDRQNYNFCFLYITNDPIVIGIGWSQINDQYLGLSRLSGIYYEEIIAYSDLNFELAEKYWNEE